MQKRFESDKECDRGLEEGRQPCQLVIPSAEGKERANEGEEEVDTREGRAEEAMEGVDERRKMVG